MCTRSSPSVLAAIVYSGGMTFVLLKLISVVLPLRATAEDEITGLDLSLHGLRGIRT